MKTNGATLNILAIILGGLVAACGDMSSGDGYESDTSTSGDTAGWHDGHGGHDTIPSPDATYSDTASDMPWDGPIPDVPAEDVVEETEPPPEDVCEEVITDPQVLYLSADDSNSMASPIIARAIIEKGDLVRAGMVRTYEFTNYYDINYAPAAFGRVNVFIHMKPEESEGPDFHNMQIGVQAHDLAHYERRPLNLTFIMDTSGSMSGSPIELERDVCRAVASSLRAGDVVSMVVWDVGDATILDSYLVSGPDDATLLGICGGLMAGGGTNLHGGLEAGYAQATDNYSPDYLNRVILVSDGQANVGITDETIIAGAAEDEESEGIYLVGVGVGTGYNDTLMDAVTDAGKGAYVFIDSEQEANKIFRDRFLSTLEIAVMDVQVELTLPPWLRIQEFHGEEISTDPKEVEPQHLAPNDAMIFHQLLKSCTELVFDNEIRAVARYTDPATRYRHTGESVVTIAGLLDSQSDTQLVKGTAVVEYAEGLKDISELIDAGDDIVAQATCDDLKARLATAADQTGDVELAEIRDLLNSYCSNLGSRFYPSWY